MLLEYSAWLFLNGREFAILDQGALAFGRRDDAVLARELGRVRGQTVIRYETQRKVAHVLIVEDALPFAGVVRHLKFPTRDAALFGARFEIKTAAIFEIAFLVTVEERDLADAHDEAIFLCGHEMNVRFEIVEIGVREARNATAWRRNFSHDAGFWLIEIADWTRVDIRGFGRRRAEIFPNLWFVFEWGHGIRIAIDELRAGARSRTKLSGQFTEPAPLEVQMRTRTAAAPGTRVFGVSA